MLDVIPVILVCAAILAGGYAALGAAARRQQRLERGAGAFTSARISFLGTYTQAFQRCLDLLQALNAELLSADPSRGILTAGTPPYGWALGCTVRLSLQTQEGVTFVTVEAAPSVNPLGGAEARRLVRRFLQLWERLPAPTRTAGTMGQ